MLIGLSKDYHSSSDEKKPKGSKILEYNKKILKNIFPNNVDMLDSNELVNLEKLMNSIDQKSLRYLYDFLNSQGSNKLSNLQDLQNILTLQDLPKLQNFQNSLNLVKLPDFQKNMLKKHKSVKYAYLMNKYYERFIDDISTLMFLGIDGSFENNPGDFQNIIINIEEIIWLFEVNRITRQIKDDSEKFNINNALHDVISEIDQYTDPEKDKYTAGKTIEMTDEKEYNLKLEALEKEYFERVERNYKNLVGEKEIENFYSCIGEIKPCLFDVKYMEKYIKFFTEYIYVDNLGDSNETAKAYTTEKRLEIIRNYLGSYMDIHGRLFVPLALNNIDKLFEISAGIVSLLRKEKTIEIKNIPSDDLQELRHNFIYIKKEPGGYHVYRNSYDKNIDDYKMTECDSYSVMNMINMTALPEEYTSVICKLSSFLCEEITILTLNDKEIDMAKEYFKSCICSTTIDEFNKNIDKINADLKDFRSIISEYDTYKKIKNNIDKGIGAIWSKEVFHEKDKGSRKKKKAKSRRKNR